MNIYRRAAQKVHEAGSKKWNIHLKVSELGVPSCGAIYLCWRDEDHVNARTKYALVFAPMEGAGYHKLWLNDSGLKAREITPWRVTALCFAAAMHEAGDL